MLLAVEGGGLFTSSVTGYSKGFTLLFFGRKNEEKPMRVTPWNQYQLVEQEKNPEFQLASGKGRVPHGCAAIVCFGRASSGLEGSSPPKVGPIREQDRLTQPSISDEAESRVTDPEENESGVEFNLKSSLKKPSDCAQIVCGDEDLHVGEDECIGPGSTQRRKVQWTDACGKDLVEVREFELSDVGEGFEGDNEKSCVCAIM